MLKNPLNFGRLLLPRVNEFLKSTIILQLYQTDIYKERQVL